MARTNGTFDQPGRAARLRAVGIGAIIATALVVLVVGVFPQRAGAQTAPSLGGAESFAVLGGSTVTNTDTQTNVYGNLGVNPGTAVTGFSAADGGQGVVHGTIYTGTDGEAVSARTGVTAAYGVLAGQGCMEDGGDLTGQDLGGLTLLEGVYCFDTSAGMTGTLTLDAQQNPNAVFIIRTGSTLTTASGSSVNLINGASACNVFWQVGSSATLGTTTSFAGNILATASITLNTGATLNGRALAGAAGAVTMDDNVVDVRPCSNPPTPEPATATAIAQATSTAEAEATLTPVTPATATAIAQATSTAEAEATLTPAVPGTGTPTADATLTPIVPGTGTPTADGTPTPVVPGTGTPTADGTPTPVVPGTGTPTTDATPSPAAPGTGTPTADATPSPAAPGTGTPANQQTPTLAAPDAPSAGSGPAGGSTASLPFAAAGAVLLLLGASGFIALGARRGSENSRPHQ